MSRCEDGSSFAPGTPIAGADTATDAGTGADADTDAGIVPAVGADYGL